MTEPRPRLTKTAGNVQQTSVDRDVNRPTAARTRSRIPPPSKTNEPFPRSRSDQQNECVQMRRIVRACERSSLESNGSRDNDRARVRQGHGRAGRRMGHLDGCCGRGWSRREMVHRTAAVIRRAHALAGVVRRSAAGHRREVRCHIKTDGPDDRNSRDDDQQPDTRQAATAHKELLHIRAMRTLRSITGSLWQAGIGKMVEEQHDLSERLVQCDMNDVQSPTAVTEC